MQQAGIRFGSTGPREREEPAGDQADGSTPWQGPRPRLLSWDVLAGVFPGFTARHRNKMPPPSLPFRTQALDLADVPGSGHLERLFGPWLDEGTPVQLRFAPWRLPLQLSCHGTLFRKSGCSLAILASPLRPIFHSVCKRRQAVRVPQKSP